MSAYVSIVKEENKPWTDLQAKIAKDELIHLQGGHMQFMILKAGMKSGRSSVTMRIDLPDGKVLLQELSLRLLKSTVELMVAASGDSEYL